MRNKNYLKKTNCRLNDCINDAHTSGSKVCRYYKRGQPFRCRNCAKCPHLHVDSEEVLKDSNARENIKLELHLHRCQIDSDVYKHLNDN